MNREMLRETSNTLLDVELFLKWAEGSQPLTFKILALPLIHQFARSTSRFERRSSPRLNNRFVVCETSSNMGIVNCVASDRERQI